jgi:hypothetical protein
MLYKDAVAVDCTSQTEHIHKLCEQNEEIFQFWRDNVFGLGCADGK